MKMNRTQRRAAVSKAKKDIRVGRWTPFEKRLDAMEHWPTDGALGTMVEAYSNSLYSVQVYIRRRLGLSTVHWYGVRRHDGGKAPWADLQRIKNDICGPKIEGVQLLPPDALLVDQANMYWFAVLSEPLNLAETFPMLGRSEGGAS